MALADTEQITPLEEISKLYSSEASIIGYSSEASIIGQKPALGISS